MTGSASALVGRVLGGTYQVERLLGEGGMGAVFAARNVRTGRLYAVKVLLPQLSQRREALARFEREARALAALGHVGIVAIHDFATEPDGLAFLVMDKLEGEELGQRLQRAGPLTAEQAVRIALEISDALSAAHSLGLVHRDLKPSNVFLTRREGEGERAVLLDFGLARSVQGGDEVGLGKVTASGVVMGTPHYMSPEQAQGIPVDARSDVYSLGAILFEMLSGRPPFEGPTLATLFALLVTTEAPTLASLGVPVDPRLDALVHACLEKDPSRRPDGAASLAGLLGTFPRASGAGAPPVTHPRSPAFAEQATVSATPVVPYTRGGPTAPPPSSNRTLWIAAIVVFGFGVGTLVLGAGLFFALRSRGPLAHVEDLPTFPVVDDGGDAGAGPDAASHPAASPDAGVQVPALPALGEPTSPRRPAHPRIALAPDPPAAPAPPVAPPSGPPGAVRPPGQDQIEAAAARIGEGDPAGCLRELRSAPETLNVLGMRMSCAMSAHDDSALRDTCTRLRERFPASPNARVCASVAPH